MKERSCGSTIFSDWWAYKFEVNDAIHLKYRDYGKARCFNSY
jgi:hypothetical protein